MFCSRSLLITGKLYNKFTRSLVITFKHHFCCHTWEIFLVHVRNPFSACGGYISVLILTMQRYIFSGNKKTHFDESHNNKFL